MGVDNPDEPDHPEDDDSSLPSFDLRSLPFSPVRNPFVEGAEIRIRQRAVRTRAASRDLLDPETGQIIGASLIHIIEERDEAQFVKIFAEGVRAAFDLGKAGVRVFQLVLHVYERQKMNGGYAESLSLFWYGEGLDGQPAGMSEFTFRRGLRELLSKGFLFPRKPNEYWVNPALFFKGDRVAFLREYRLNPSPSAKKLPPE